MRKALPMSALITGLLALPGAGAVSTAAAAGAALVAPVPAAFPAAMPAAVALQMRRLARGEKLDAHGMQVMQQRLTAEIQGRLSHAVAERERLYPVQLASPVSALVPGRTEKAAFLGVATTPAPAIVREQLNLPRGVGLVVDYLEKDSPAALAGLKVNDVVAKLDDQWLINGQQLAVLVRDKKPGDTVTLTVIHGGKSQPVTVKLVEKELALLEDIPVPVAPGVAPAAPGGIIRMEGALPQMFPPNMAGSSFSMSSDGSSVRRSVDDQNDITVTRTADGKEALAVKDREGHVLYEGPGEGLDKAKLSDELVKKIDGLRKGPNDIRPHIGDVPPAGTGTKAFTANRKDDAHDITLRSDGTGRHVTVKETPTGKTLFDGPMTSDEDLKALPAALQEKIKAMQEKIK